VGSREGQPDRRAPTEQLARVVARLVVAEDVERLVGRQQRPKAER
jgi:hypothetical protein